MLLAVLVALTSPGTPASAETAGEAAQAAAAAAARVDTLLPEVERARIAQEAALAVLAGGTSQALSAQRAADEAGAEMRRAGSDRVRRVRGLYMSGGTLALYAGMLTARSAGELLRTYPVARRLVSADEVRTRAVATTAATAATVATRMTAAAADGAVTARDVTADVRRLDALLARADATLADLSVRARSLADAEAAAARLRRARAAADAARAALTGPAVARAAPADYASLYRAAAATCPGLSWAVLAAIGQVETGHGRNVAVSSAVARGPMQFLPSTFVAYAADGDGDGIADIDSPADAVFSAARYLCANGGGDPRRLPRAIWHYNHAQWYVDLVLGIARQLSGPSGWGSSPPTAMDHVSTPGG